MEILKDKKIYFSSDNHLGSPTLEESKEREKIFPLPSPFSFSHKLNSFAIPKQKLGWKWKIWRIQ